MSNELSIDEQIASLNAQKQKEQLDKELKLLSDFKCEECGAKLLNRKGVYTAIDKEYKPSELIVKGSKAIKVECPKCERLTEISVEYKSEPAQGNAIIRIRKGAYAFNELMVKDLNDKQVDRALEDELERLNNYNSGATRMEQLFLRKLLRK